MNKFVFYAANHIRLLKYYMLAALILMGGSGFSNSLKNPKSSSSRFRTKSISLTNTQNASYFDAANQPDTPVISSFSPTSADSGTIVLIHGRNFTPVGAVSFGNVPASAFNILSDSLIQAVVGTGASGYIEVTAFGTTGYVADSALQVRQLSLVTPHWVAQGLR